MQKSLVVDDAQYKRSETVRPLAATQTAVKTFESSSHSPADVDTAQTDAREFVAQNKSLEATAADTALTARLVADVAGVTHVDAGEDAVSVIVAYLGRLSRIEPALDQTLDLAKVARQTVEGAVLGMTQVEVSTLLAETAAYLSSHHPDYEALAARIAVDALHARTPKRFSESIAELRAHTHPKLRVRVPLINDLTAAAVEAHADVLDAAIVHERDYAYSYFGFKTLERSYLMQNDKRIVERPQYMIMRVAVGIHGNDIASALGTYDLMSRQLFTHATPTLFNAGTPNGQLSSCFLLTVQEDSIVGIYDTLKQCALISKAAGGVGFAAHKVRARNAYIAGTNGNANGLVPMLKVFNDTARYVDQCFTPETPIVTAEWGPVPIGNLYRYALAGNADAAVKEIHTSKNGADADAESVSKHAEVGKEGTEAVPIRGVTVLSATGRWCPLSAVVRHVPPARPTGDDAATKDGTETSVDTGVTVVRIRSSTTMMPKFGTPTWVTEMDDDDDDDKSTAGTRKRARACFAAETKVTPQHQIMVLCDALDNDTPVVVARPLVSEAAPQPDVADNDTDRDGESSEVPKTDNDDDDDALSDDKEDDKGGDETRTAREQLCDILYRLCERIDKGYVVPKLVDAGTLEPGMVLCHVVPPEPEPSETNEGAKTSDWRMAGLLTAAIDLAGTGVGNTGPTFLTAPSGSPTAHFIDTYIAIAEGRTVERADKALRTDMDGNVKNRRWRITHPALEKALALTRSMAHMAAASNRDLDAYVMGLAETLDGRKVSAHLSDTLRWLSLRLVPRALLRLNPEAAARKRSAVLSVVPGNEAEDRPDIWSVAHDNRLYVPVESVEFIKRSAPATSFDASTADAVGASAQSPTTDSGLYDLEVDDEEHIYTTLGVGACHNGGGKRKGAFACYLEPWHADILDWLDLKKNHGKEEDRARDLFYALWMCDLFMRRMIADESWSLFCPSEAPDLYKYHGPAFDALYERYEREGRARSTIPARQLWWAILDVQTETGAPYILYKDAANATSNQKNLGTIECSNLCVAPETRVLTDRGHLPIASLVGQCVRVWNGDTWSEVEVAQTGAHQPLLTVTLDDGARLTCTPYHKFILASDSDSDSSDTGKGILGASRVDASKLAEGTRLVQWTPPVIEGDPQRDFRSPFAHGLFSADGEYDEVGHPRLVLRGESKVLIAHLDLETVVCTRQTAARFDVMLPINSVARYKVPHGASLRNRLDWFAGLVDGAADPATVLVPKNDGIAIRSSNRAFLDDVRLLLQTMGAHASITAASPLPHEVMGEGQKAANAPCHWRLSLSSSALGRLVSLGLSTRRVSLDGIETKNATKQVVTVQSVENLGRIDDTFCFTEPLNHAGVFEGVCTGQCTEVIQYSSDTETSVCNLASVALPKFVASTAGRTGGAHKVERVSTDGRFVYDFEALHEVVQVMVRNLNRVIDVNGYPLPETRRSNLRHRPMGVGVQGLADTFALMGYTWESDEARLLNRDIFETIYHAALTASSQLAAKEGTYETYEGSPASQGLLHMDLWEAAANDARRWEGCDGIPIDPRHRVFDVRQHASGRWDWDGLRAEIRQHGLRNSLLVAPMPTASTSQILNNNESIEPTTTNLFTRRVLAGDFPVINRHLVRRLMERGLWNEQLRNRLVAAHGSVQDFGDDEVPADLRALFRTAWEIPKRVVIDMAADRSPYIDQSQSLNLYCEKPTSKALTSMHAYAWRRGLKTGMYYLRTRPAANAIQFTVDTSTLAAAVVATAPDNNDGDSDSNILAKGAESEATSGRPQRVPTQGDIEDGVCYPGCLSCSG